MEKSKDNRFVIIVRIEKYIEHMLTILLKLPRTEKFSIGTEVKTSMYEMMKNILLASKIDKNKRLSIYNIVDSNIYYQRICIRIMYNQKWIDEKKYKHSNELLAEIGKILGGLIKSLEGRNMPKTIKNIYDNSVSFENLLKAHKKARCGKREKKKIILFELKLEQELLELEKKLKNGTYKHGGYTKFKIYEPKERIIMASEYKDRVVHRWYVEKFIKPYFVPQFISTSYAGIEGRGMHKASKDVQKAMRSAKSKWKNYYILKMDVTKYFQNIDKRILWEILKRKMKDKKLLWLTREILLSTEGIVGLPLGNYTSQMFANIYLNELDQYVKHKLKCRYYYRYMDDMVIMCENKEIAKDSLNNITKFLKENLKLTLNSKTRIFKDIQGVNFCGYKINEKRLKIRHTSKCRMKRKLKRYTRQLKEGKITLPEIQRSIAGWLGYVKHADSYNLRKSMFYIEG